MIVEEARQRVSVASPSARAAVEAVMSEFSEFGEKVSSDDPLEWPGYEDQLAAARERSGEREAVITGEALVGETPVVVISFDFRFFGGSVGQATGQKIIGAFERARENRVPVVSLVATGGARMQEGMLSLVQLQGIADARVAASAEGIPHICVVRDPTTGGPWVSLAASADYIIGVDGAAVSFAGSRVRDREDVDAAFTTRGKLEGGYIDLVAGSDEVPGVLEKTVRMLSLGEDGPLTQPEVPRSLGYARLPREAWAAVMRARRPQRPKAAAYLDDYFDERIEISGDRVGGVNSGVVCGFGRRRGRLIAYAAQDGTAATAADFRTVKRLMELAGNLQRPVLTLIDTPGARNGVEDEKAGVGTAIAELFCSVANLNVPITSLVIGEGGSGGALALAAPDNLWITPDGYFAVIAPEGAAAIVEKDRSKAREISEHMKLTPQDLVDLGVVRGIAPHKRHPAQAFRMSYDAVRRWMKVRSGREQD